ncbi:unnamed protein product [Linum tenue]|uniref:Uncharacterized protein n=1 Tax=Linum tenue TaxID=586396 RepID=A0AAV0L2R8_9ROSI|nr:unnamed protein product [Linum tenue]
MSGTSLRRLCVHRMVGFPSRSRTSKKGELLSGGLVNWSWSWEWNPDNFKASFKHQIFPFVTASGNVGRETCQRRCKGVYWNYHTRLMRFLMVTPLLIISNRVPWVAIVATVLELLLHRVQNNKIVE